ncbi:MAG: helix-turn-helix transcriptional regulator [Clostridia bacterium]|nr:helix-turn-helix transcriptional regulator [Clostridia bacterium]
MISYRPFRVLVAEKNLETTALAQELGISPSTMAKLNAKKEENEAVSLKTIDKLCKHFGVSIDQIVEIR